MNKDQIYGKRWTLKREWYEFKISIEVYCMMIKYFFIDLFDKKYF